MRARLPRPRLPRRRPARTRLLAVTGAAGLAAALGLMMIQRTPGVAVSAFVAIEPVAAGTILDDSTLAERFQLVRLRSATPLVGVIGDPGPVRDRRVAEDLTAGEPLTLAAMGGGRAVPAPLAPGERAVPVPAQPSAAAGQVLSPGTLVDVVASTGEGPAGRTRVVVAGAEVLAVDAPASGGTAEPGGVVLLRARSGDALRITAALNFSRDVRLLARPAGDMEAAVQEVAGP